MKIEHKNELGLTKADMQFWTITLLLVGILFATMVIADKVRWG